MKKIIVYDKKTTYMYPNGKVATPEKVLSDYPACEYFTHVIETNESKEVIYGFYSLSGLRSHHGIDKNLSEEEAIEKIEEIINTPKEVSTELTTEERTAQALEEIARGTTSESTDVINILLTGEEA